MTQPLVEYTPYGAALDLFHARDDEVLIVGPAGTGKSLAALHKINLMALNNPGLRGLIVRKTQVSLTSSGLVTFKKFVVPELVKAGVVEWYGGSRDEAAAYRYQNGSRIEVGGMDKSTKIMSTEYDVIYVQEATELTIDDWESLSTRLRSGVVSFQQLIADCNPAEDTHWLKKRCDAGLTRMLHSRHEDNPTLFNRDGTLTETGAAYIGRLDKLTGVRKRRLRDGEWSSAEGVIYEEWDSAAHLVDPFPIPDDWPRYWVVDFGFTNPFVWQSWAEDPDGRLYLYREWYRTQMLVEDHARIMLATVTHDDEWREPRPAAIVADHDAEGRATLERYLSQRVTPARKAVMDGIQAVKARLAPAGDDRPRVFVLRDSLMERDPDLVEAAKPTCLYEEVGAYTWKETRGLIKEEPVKEDDHAMDCLRYMVAHRDPIRPGIPNVPVRQLA